MAANTFPETGGDRGNDLKKRVYCIISDERVFRTKSPAMFNAAIAHSGINGVYVPLMVEPPNLEQATRSLLALNFAGANITVPYKERVIPYLDILSEGANIIQAVNTITVENGQLKGYNTNAIGFMKAMEEVGFQPADKSVLVFGAGGAARAVVFILNWLRAKPIFVAARDLTKAEKIAEDFNGEAISLDDLKFRKISANLVVNATSVSTREESPEMAEIAEQIEIADCQWLVDLNYGRSDNFWQDLALKAGTRFMDGLPMLAQQASKSFALWTRLQVPPAVFLSGL
jgi:shikimate dehydrogenase